MKSPIRWPTVLSLFSPIPLVLAAGMLFPLLLALLDDDTGLESLGYAFVICISIGVSMGIALGRPQFGLTLSRREAILLVVLCWLAAAALGAIPFFLSPHFSSLGDALFESTSGFTTTGGSILASVEALPRSLLLWRSLTQWLGGMGAILLGLAILPLLSGGEPIHQTEYSGIVSERLVTRIFQGFRSVAGIYGLLTVLAATGLALSGLTPFDALGYALSVVSTGGFSHHDQGLRSIDSVAAEAIIALFMLLSAVSFARHYEVLVQREPRKAANNRQLRLYFTIAGLAILILWVSLMLHSELGAAESFRVATFQGVSTLSSSGLQGSHISIWGPFIHVFLLLLVVTGGCTGSSSGGFKVARIDLLFKAVAREFRILVERRGVFAVRVQGVAVSESSIKSLINLVGLGILTSLAAWLVLCASGLDLFSALSLSLASVFNVGPGFMGAEWATGYFGIPTLAKWALIACMLLGRLEFYALFALFSRLFWKR